jgi:hypothetical protein
MAPPLVLTASATPPSVPTTLVDTVDVSDTFTEGLNGRVADQSFPVGAGDPNRLVVENAPATGAQSWTDDKWSFAKDSNHAAGPWCGSSSRGSATGVVQAGLAEATVPGLAKDWGVTYGIRNDFVLQTDVCVDSGATVNLTTASIRDTELQGDGLTIRLRPTGDSRGEVILDMPGAGGDHITGLTSGLTAGAWHVAAARFDLADHSVQVYVDDVLRGSLDITGYSPSNAAVSVGVDLGSLDPTRQQVAWFDNFLVGHPSGAADPPADPGYVQGPTVTPPAQTHLAFRLFKGTMNSELGPGSPPSGGDGNTYAPEVHLENGLYRMWYGGQGTDGYEHIHYAESTDGYNWKRYGIVLSEAPGHVPQGQQTYPLIEDASVVKVDGTYHMYYTAAPSGTVDVIRHATSADGIHWTVTGTVLTPDAFPAWDSLDVARPSVRYESPGNWKMWYDGCQGVYAGTGAEPCLGFRNAGYATSTDGLHWTKSSANPIISPIEAVNVVQYRGTYFMVGESQQGTRLESSLDGVSWTDRGFLVGLSGGPDDQSGQITPDLLLGPDGLPKTLYMGLGRNSCWCQNLMGAALLDGTELDAFVAAGAPPATPFPDFSTVPVTSSPSPGDAGRCGHKRCKVPGVL